MREILPIIFGPTAIGKTKLGLKLARRFNGEIIPADSRQIYRFLDIGTGKDFPARVKFVSLPMPSWVKRNDLNWGYFLFGRIKIWLLDLITPDKKFSAVDWSLIASELIKEIRKRGSLPIVVGGNAFYIKILIDGIDYFGVAPDQSLRKQLERKSIEELQEYLKLIWPEKFEKMNFSDKRNPRRLIRAIEIKQSSLLISSKKFLEDDCQILGIVLLAPFSLIKKNIWLRIETRLKKGLLKEIEKVLKMGFSWDDPGLNTLAYKEFREFFEGKKTLKEAIALWYKDEIAYAKRQLNWFRRDRRFFRLDTTSDDFNDNLTKLVAKSKI